MRYHIVSLFFKTIAIGTLFILSQGLFLPLNGGTLNDGFDAPTYDAGTTASPGASLTGQPISYTGPWISNWIQGQGTANSNEVWTYTDAAAASSTAPTTSPTGDPLTADSQLVAIENSTTVIYRSFLTQTSGTISASFSFYINSDIIASQQAVEFSSFFSSEGVGNVSGGINIDAAIGVHNFGKNNSPDLQWAYWDPNAGKKGDWVKFSEEPTVAEGWNSVTLAVDLDNASGPIYSANLSGDDGQTGSVEDVTYGDSSITSDDLLRSVGFTRVSAGSGEILYVDELQVVGVTPEPSTIIMGFAFLSAGILPWLVRRFRVREESVSR